MEILQHTKEYVVCRKDPGVNSEHTEAGDGMPDLLEKELGQRIYPVHRLDQTTGGLMVFACTSRAAAELSAQMQDNRFRKEYLAVVHGILPEKAGEMTDELFFDRRKGKSFPCDRKRNGTKTARLAYTVAAESEEHGGVSLCRIQLYTGRTHQIRVQFASRKHPLLGDGKYGSRYNTKDCALWSCRLCFTAPDTHKEVSFTDVPPRGEVFGLFPPEAFA